MAPLPQGAPPPHPTPPFPPLPRPPPTPPIPPPTLPLPIRRSATQQEFTEKECGFAFESLSLQNEDVFFHCDQLIKSIYLVRYPMYSNISCLLACLLPFLSTPPPPRRRAAGGLRSPPPIPHRGPPPAPPAQLFVEGWTEAFHRNDILFLRLEDYIKDTPATLKAVMTCAPRAAAWPSDFV